MTIVTGNLHLFPRRQPRPRNHKWAEPIRLQYKTERVCEQCGIVKVTRHEPGRIPWIEYWRGLEKIAASGTPPCEVVS